MCLSRDLQSWGAPLFDSTTRILLQNFLELHTRDERTNQGQLPTRPGWLGQMRRRAQVGLSGSRDRKKSGQPCRPHWTESLN
ncbi:hypothetical protein Taro_031594, partial [Colocasia esculenta]|nr:hypothetical protein [Colocasia esculenta]